MRRRELWFVAVVALIVSLCLPTGLGIGFESPVSPVPEPTPTVVIGPTPTVMVGPTPTVVIDPGGPTAVGLSSFTAR